MGRPLTTRSMRVRAFKCPKTGKRSYQTEVEAKIAMAGTKDNVKRRAKEQRVFPCGMHFHLTSQTVEEYNRRKASFEKGTS